MDMLYTYCPVVVVLLIVAVVVMLIFNQHNNFMEVFAASCTIVTGEVVQYYTTSFSYDYWIKLSDGNKVLCICDKKYNKKVGDSAFVCISGSNSYLLEEVLDVPGCEETLCERGLIKAS